MRSGFNPTRRNRNIGTSKQGHGQNNKLTIPAICHAERSWWGQLGEHKQVYRSLAGRNLLFIVEATRDDSFHACTIDDICHLLRFVPLEDWEFLETFVLRQSTRKQEIKNPSWGRLAYSATLGRPAQSSIASGPALFLEAQHPNKIISWSASLDPDDQAEFERLKADGHKAIKKGRRFLLSCDLQSIRATQLYRTVLHEIGHWVDWLQKVVRPSGDDPDLWERHEDLYFSRPSAEREAFAHLYGVAAGERLRSTGRIPFDRVIDRESLDEHGMRKDFLVAEKE
jgi:hypothetical protein